jgi:hypothetical protein
MSNILPSRSSSPAAQRMRNYRKRRRYGMQFVRVPLHVTDIDDLIRMGLLKEEERHDAEALEIAVLNLVFQAKQHLRLRVTTAARRSLED